MVLDDAARIPALQNNAHRRHRAGLPRRAHDRPQHAGIAIRRAPGPSWYHFTFNGAQGSILADPALRLAISKGIDRQAIANVTQRGLVDNPAPLNNHIYVAGQEGYQDNSAVVAYDPEEAKRELDALGWTTQRPVPREGRPATGDPRRALRRAEHPAVRPDRAEQPRPDRRQTELDAKGGSGFFSQYINPGDFDIAQFSWVGDAFPLCWADPDLPVDRREQLRQDRQPRDRRKDRSRRSRNSTRTRPARWPTNSTS